MRGNAVTATTMREREVLMALGAARPVSYNGWVPARHVGKPATVRRLVERGLIEEGGTFSFEGGITLGQLKLSEAGRVIAERLWTEKRASKATRP